jgi:hypothetical protein
VTEKSEYLPIDKFVDKSRSGCPLYFENFPKNLKTRKLYCGSLQGLGNLYYGILEFEGPHGPVPATILTSKSHLPPSGYIFYIHGGPASPTYAGYSILPSKVSEAVYECNLALIDIAYAGSKERSFYPENDGKYALSEIRHIIGSFQKNEPNKIAIWGESFGASLSIFSKLDNIPIYLSIPVLNWDDVVEYVQSFEKAGKRTYFDYDLFSIEEKKMIKVQQEPYFYSYYYGTEFRGIQPIDYLIKYNKNVKHIVFHGKDERVLLDKYRDAIDKTGVPYTIIENAVHSDLRGRQGEESAKAYQPLFDDICERSGWMDWTAADG